MTTPDSPREDNRRCSSFKAPSSSLAHSGEPGHIAIQRVKNRMKHSILSEFILVFLLLPVVGVSVMLPDPINFALLSLTIVAIQRRSDTIFLEPSVLAVFGAFAVGLWAVGVSAFLCIALSIELTLLGYVITFILFRKATNAQLKSMPGPWELNGWMGIVPEMVKHIGGNTLWKWRESKCEQYGQTWVESTPIFERDCMVNLASPQDIEHVLKTNVDNYIKSPGFQQVLQEILGSGIFGVNHAWAEDKGETWRIQRKTTSRIFTGNNFRSHFMHCFVEHGIKVQELLVQLAQTGESFDAQSMFFRYTLDCIGQLGFGIDLGCLSDKELPFASAFDRAQHLAFTRFFTVGWRLPVSWLLSPAERELRQCVDILDGFARQVINERKEDKTLEQKDDLLSLFLRAEEDNGEKVNYSDTFLRDMILNVAIAGRDTTACTLTWMFYMLSTNPDIQEKLVQEIDVKLGQHEPTYENLAQSNMPYLHGCVSETLRLWPPVPVDPKQCVMEDTLPSGFTIPAGTQIQYHPYVMGRDSRLWKDANKVDPERWIGVTKPSAYTFPVFQAGPRICLGMNMAYLESKVLTCMILQKFTLTALPSHEVIKNVGITLSSKTGFKVNATARK